MRLVQFLTERNQRGVGLADRHRINVLKNIRSTYDLFFLATLDQTTIQNRVHQLASDRYEDYAALIKEKRILVPLDHPDPYHTWITGTGLTHLGSAASRNAMHLSMDPTQNIDITDSMKMFRMGMENGKMKGNTPASQPEWFYKGNGLVSVHPEQPIYLPTYALDGGEEPELAGLYINDARGNPHRIGFALGNEFSDHKMERINYLYLAHSKLRSCSYGPELLLDDLPSKIVGRSRIIRNKAVLWEKEFLTGEGYMTHNFANLEHHHFKYYLFRQPGDVHVHFMGTSVISFADQIEAKKDDIFEIESAVFGKPLRNPLAID